MSHVIQKNVNFVYSRHILVVVMVYFIQRPIYTYNKLHSFYFRKILSVILILVFGHCCIWWWCVCVVIKCVYYTYSGKMSIRWCCRYIKWLRDCGWLAKLESNVAYLRVHLCKVYESTKLRVIWNPVSGTCFLQSIFLLFLQCSSSYLHVILFACVLAVQLLAVACTRSEENGYWQLWTWKPRYWNVWCHRFCCRLCKFQFREVCFGLLITYM